jgi:hypothetical protein
VPTVGREAKLVGDLLVPTWSHIVQISGSDSTKQSLLGFFAKGMELCLGIKRPYAMAFGI